MEEQTGFPAGGNESDSTPHQRQRPLLRRLLGASWLFLALLVLVNLRMVLSLTISVLSVPFQLLDGQYNYEESPAAAVIEVNQWRNSYQHWLYVDSVTRYEDDTYQLNYTTFSNPFSMNTNESPALSVVFYSEQEMEISAAMHNKGAISTEGITAIGEFYTSRRLALSPEKPVVQLVFTLGRDPIQEIVIDLTAGGAR